MNRKTFGLKLAALTLAGVAVLASPAAWAEKKGKPADKAEQGPSVQETVEFINGLLSCDIPKFTKTGAQTNIENGGMQRSELKFSSLQSELIENTKIWYGFMDPNGPFGEPMRAYHGYALSSVTTIPWAKLEQVESPKDANVELHCNPSYGDCLRVINREATFESVYSSHDRSYTDLKDGPCRSEAMKCAEAARAYLDRKEPTQKTMNSYNINFCRPDDAVRAVKAINHLIQINGGKKSLF